MITLKVEKKNILKKLQEIADTYQSPKEVMEMYLKNPELMREIETVVLEELAVEKILEMMQVKDKVITYQEALALGQGVPAAKEEAS